MAPPLLALLLLLCRIPTPASAQNDNASTTSPSEFPSEAPSSAPYSTEAMDEATWVAIRATAIINAITMALLLTLYEVGRRVPIFRDIYDRKRETRPGRTPPKLLTTTRGRKWGGCRWWCGWAGRLLECLFVDGYVDARYSAFALRQREAKAKKPSRRSLAAADIQHVGEEEDGGSVRSGGVNGLDGKYGGADSAREGTPITKVVGPLDRHDENDDDEEDDEPSSDEDNDNFREDDGKKELNSKEQRDSTKKLPPEGADDDEAASQKSEEAEAEAVAVSTNNEGIDDDPQPTPDTNTTTTPNETDTVPAETKSSDSAPSRWAFLWMRGGSTLREHHDEGDASAAAAKAIRREQIPRHFRWMTAFPLLKPRPLDAADREILRCIGLDTFVMIRILRLGFEVTFYPFLVACVTLIPLYYTNDYEGAYSVGADGAFSTTVTNGYFSITINKLEAGSAKLWGAFATAVLYHFFLLRRIRVEWMVFVDLRKDFLSDGDRDAVEEDDEESLKQYRNSVLVEYVPSSHRRDKDIKLFYESLFPGLVRRAEMVMDSEELTKLIKKRQRFLELYENAQARHIHRTQIYEKKLEAFESGGDYDGDGTTCGCSRRTPTEPAEPKIRVDGKCSRGEEVLALPYYMSEIERLDGLVQDEFESLVKRKQQSERTSVIGEQDPVSLIEGAPKPRELQNWDSLENYLYTIFVPPAMGGAARPAFGNCGNGFVEFTTRSAKQAALQCNLTGLNGVFDTLAAPDPRDVVWENAMIERTTTKRLSRLSESLLLVGILFWAGLVSLIANIKNIVVESQGSQDLGNVLLGVVVGYLPVLLLTILMALLPILFNVLGVNFIRFKARSEVDKFAMKWNFNYRLANFLAVLVAGTLYSALLDFRKDPQNTLNKLASGILEQSQFFFNIVLTSIGTSTMIQLSQLWSVLYWILVRSICSFEGVSERNLKRMHEPKWFIFGRFTPEFIYILMIGIVYSTMVPMIIGGCSLYFFVASKVYTHQALFVFSQRYEGGGKLMYSITQILFIVIYMSIIIFGITLSLKESTAASVTFLVLMIPYSIYNHYRIHHDFIRPSQTLPLTRARILDEEYKSLLSDRETASRRSVDSKEQQKSCIPVSSEVGEASSLASPVPFRGDRRVLLKHQVDSATFRGINEQGAGMGIGQPHWLSQDGDSNADLDCYLYRQPDLNKAVWETKPRPYRSNV